MFWTDKPTNFMFWTDKSKISNRLTTAVSCVIITLTYLKFLIYFRHFCRMYAKQKLEYFKDYAFHLVEANRPMNYSNFHIPSERGV